MGGYLKRELDPFPIHKIKRVDKPTIRIDFDKVQRVSEREAGFCKAAAGDYGSRIKREMQRFVEKHPLSAATSWIRRAMKPLASGIEAPQKAPIPSDPEVLSQHIKEVAYFLRADAVGICELPGFAVYSHKFDFKDPESLPVQIELNHKFAIGILVDQDWKTANASTGSDWISNAMSMMSYATSGFIAIILADYIRRLGYPAKAHYAPYYDVVVPPILLMAGLGEMSRLGDSVIHPFLGPRFKAAVVTTDMPLKPDKPIDCGVQDFCSKCKKCARECPSGAISDGKKEIYNGYEKWPFDKRKCTMFRVGNQRGSGCGTCIKVCPWNKPYTLFHKAVGWMMRKSSLARKFAIIGDDLLGYGKPDYSKKWWFDLEDVNGDGILQLPRNVEYSPEEE